MKFWSIICYLTRHDWTRAVAPGVIVWECARCGEERLVGDSRAVSEYRAAPDVPPAKERR